MKSNEYAHQGNLFAAAPPSTFDEMVEEFAMAADQPKNPRMSWKLVEEEYRELLAEVITLPRDRGNTLKEMADLIYVLYGYARAHNMDLSTAVRRVHCNNMERMTQDDGTIKRREDGKIIKNRTTKPVSLGDLY